MAFAPDVTITASTATLGGQVRAVALTREGDGGHFTLITTGNATTLLDLSSEISVRIDGVLTPPAP